MSGDKELPLLDDVVKRGDEDLIKAARLEREIIDELNRMAPRTPGSTPPQPALNRTPEPADGSLEQAIDAIVQYHCDAMRAEVQQLLKDRLG